MKIVVFHAGYGCDTGCCGHSIEIQDDNGRSTRKSFSFDHPNSNESPVQFAKKIIEEEASNDQYFREHVQDLDWSNCLVVKNGYDGDKDDTCWEGMGSVHLEVGGKREE